MANETAPKRKTRVHLGREFARALCKHFGLPLAQVSADVKLAAGGDEIFGAEVFITLDAADLASIASIMEQPDGR